jgi:SAM-dependent methyltransferase
MARGLSVEMRKPRTDDRPLWDVVFGVYGYPALLIAHRLKLFPLLAEKAQTISEVCEALNIKRRPAEAILTVATALGFLQRSDGRYALTPLAADYLLESSPTYFGFFWDLAINNSQVWSFASLEKAVLTDAGQAYGGRDIFKSHEEQAELARGFTRAMHSISMGPALAWPEAIDLSHYRLLLDVGCGSGARAIGALLKWPHLRALIFDLTPVCEVAEEFSARHGLQDRIQTHPGDMWHDPFPPADLHLYSNVLCDWPPEKVHFLTQKSFESLEPGGRIILHDKLYNDDKTGPFGMAAFSVIMLAWTEGQPYSGDELATMLAEVGFTNVERKPVFGYHGIVTGRKP